MGMCRPTDANKAIPEIDLDKICYPDGYAKPQLLDQQWLKAQCKRKQYLFNLMSIGKCPVSPLSVCLTECQGTDLHLSPMTPESVAVVNTCDVTVL